MRSIESRIYECYDNLSPSERQLANVVLKHQRDFSSYTATELSEKAGVSKATAARLFRSLGYKTYGEARRDARATKLWGSPLIRVEEENSASGQSQSFEGFIQADMENLRRTFDVNQASEIHRACAAISGAHRVVILGVRHGYGLAYLAKNLLGFGKDLVQVLANGSNISDDITSLKKGDLFMVVAFKRRPDYLETIFSEVRSTGAQILVIGDLSLENPSEDIVLRCHTHIPGLFTSFTSAVTILNYLGWAVFNGAGEAAQTRLEKLERLVVSVDRVEGPGDARKAPPRRRAAKPPKEA
ncbi:MAG: MurR/RpiR family transcriptional regulator [Shinella sp.]|uniref:MurR/RpiR family transcriptional regulator n=1 Tax=Shinella sp. TaxID=1870904 RepID=UPI0040361378